MVEYKILEGNLSAKGSYSSIHSTITKNVVNESYGIIGKVWKTVKINLRLNLKDRAETNRAIRTTRSWKKMHNVVFSTISRTATP